MTSKCCFCLALRTGCLIVGIIQLLLVIVDAVGEALIIESLFNGKSTPNLDSIRNGILLATSVLQAAVVVTLIVGAIKRSLILVFLYLWTESIILGSRLLLIVVYCSIPQGQSFVHILVYLLLMFLDLPFCFVIVVYRYYEELKSSPPYENVITVKC